MAAPARARAVARVLGGLTAREVRALAGRRNRPPDADPGRERARAVRHALEELGPFYVKLGQMLATRPDMVSATMISEFEQLHDQVSPLPFSDLEPVLETELGADWRGRFRSIDVDKPLGAASLAQVYRVELDDGRPGVVKIQRPGIAALMRDDMWLMRRIARVVGKRTPDFTEVIDVEAMLDMIFDTMEPELDFTREAENMDAARQVAAKFDLVAVPDVVAATPRVLVQGMAAGRPVRDVQPGPDDAEQLMAAGHDVFGFMCQSYFSERVFHADPHPGNIFLSADGVATIIDWGMVGRMDRRMSMSLLLLLISILRNDGSGAARAWIELGRVTPRGDVAGFVGDMSRLVPKLAGRSLGDIDFGTVLTSALGFATKRGISTNPMVSVLGKSYANLEGSVRLFAPQISLTDVMGQNLRRIMQQMLSEEVNEEQLAAVALETLLGGGIVRNWRSIADDAVSRGLTVQTSQIEHRRSRREDRADARAAKLRHSLVGLGAVALWLDHRRRLR
ncbi:ABC1 kinase family protein [Pseudonocardia bannensis]|uniref:AarF/ABC1/UbiB kinase family protein n=1 Tax=Pseudonocardia bannensis TaxID=630973 RepID=A0A848DDZ1_9PSEU|nr:AarF/UbiB family protein [Pseudonocardia bannensis]NMH90802.1 AarF/ABC1/UbiB kinase family protein [Pseudonocardia bannensis]